MLVATKGSPLPLPLPQKQKQKQKISQKALSTFPIHHGPYYPEVIPIPTYTYLLHITYQNIYLITRPKNPNPILFHMYLTYLLSRDNPTKIQHVHVPTERYFNFSSALFRKR